MFHRTYRLYPAYTLWEVPGPKGVGWAGTQVLGGVQAWVEKTVLQQAILKLVALFNPAGAVLQALQFTYTTVTFFLDKGRQIGDVVETYLNALGPIAEGKIGVAANAVEGALGRTVPLVLTFLARLLGLGGVPAVLKAQLQKARVPLDKGLHIVPHIKGLLKPQRYFH